MTPRPRHMAAYMSDTARNADQRARYTTFPTPATGKHRADTEQEN